VDWLGGVMLGHRSVAGEAIHRWATKQGAHSVCWTAGGLNLSSDAAALYNGSSGNIFELDDLHRGAIVHPADTIMAAALAVAQRVKRFATSVFRFNRSGLRSGHPRWLVGWTRHYQHWYSTATCGVFGAATAA
jgi:2-methylcitrate dehydratase PrpD